MTDPVKHPSARKVELTRDWVEETMRLTGGAINANDGRCALIENALIRATTLECWALDRMDDAVPRPLDDWGEDDGPVLWWRLPVDEPPFAGTPLDSDWPGRHTHWTPIPLPTEPKEDANV